MTKLEFYDGRNPKLDSYYYGFAPSGSKKIDAVLAAVSFAGDMCHHTEGWDDNLYDYDFSLCDIIQAVADRAAEQD